METSFDVIIIGGGPAGCAAALFTARAKLTTLVFDKPGWSSILERQPWVTTYPGVTGSGAQLVGVMREQARAAGAQFLGEVVAAAQLSGESKSIFTNEGGAYSARAVIITTGAYERTTQIPGEARLTGHGVSGCVACDAPLYQDKVALVIGDDDYAAWEALALAQYAKHVMLITESTAPVFSPDVLAALNANRVVELRTGMAIREITGDSTVHGALFDTDHGPEELPADGIFLYLYGSRPSAGFLLGQLSLGPNGGIITNAYQCTNLASVYAAGDVTESHIRQVVIAVSEGTIAGLAAVRDLQGREEIHLDYG